MFARQNPHCITLTALAQHAALVLGLVTLLGCAGSNADGGVIPHAEGPHQITFQVSGVDCRDCVVRIALFDDPQYWLQQDRSDRGRLLLMQGDSAEVTFYGLPAGQYAAAAYLDTNNNGQLDRWLWLLPREPVAFSMVQRLRLPPDFSQSSFRVPGDTSKAVAVRFGKRERGAGELPPLVERLGESED